MKLFQATLNRLTTNTNPDFLNTLENLVNQFNYELLALKALNLPKDKLERIKEIDHQLHNAVARFSNAAQKRELSSHIKETFIKDTNNLFNELNRIKHYGHRWEKLFSIGFSIGKLLLSILFTLFAVEFDSKIISLFNFGIINYGLGMYGISHSVYELLSTNKNRELVIANSWQNLKVIFEYECNRFSELANLSQEQQAQIKRLRELISAFTSKPSQKHAIEIQSALNHLNQLQTNYDRFEKLIATIKSILGIGLVLHSILTAGLLFAIPILGATLLNSIPEFILVAAPCIAGIHLLTQSKNTQKDLADTKTLSEKNTTDVGSHSRVRGAHHLFKPMETSTETSFRKTNKFAFS